MSERSIVTSRSERAVRPFDVSTLAPGQTVQIHTAQYVYELTATTNIALEGEQVTGVVISTGRRGFSPALAPVGTVRVDRYIVPGQPYGMGTVWRGGNQEPVRTGLVGEWQRVEPPRTEPTPRVPV